MQGIFQYINVLCLVIVLQQAHIGCPYNKRFGLQDYSQYYLLLGNMNVRSTSMTSM